MKTSKRKYDSTLRIEAAKATRESIIDSARTIFLKRGYAGTTMPEIAKAAGTALDTVYATAGKKPALFRLATEDGNLRERQGDTAGRMRLRTGDSRRNGRRY